MKRVETKTGRTPITAEVFNGIGEFLDKYENAPISEAYKDHTTAQHLQDASYTDERKRFTSVKGYEEAVGQFVNGVNVKAIKKARADAVTGEKKVMKKSVNGGRVCVPSYLSGSPACMRRRAKAPAKTELNIVIDMAVSCSIKSHQIIEAGQKVVEYITDLEHKYNVNLHAINAVNIDGGAYVCGIKIKDAGKPFSASRVSFCLTSPAFLRVFYFIWLTRAEGVPFDWGYGRPLSLDEEKEKNVIGQIYRNAVVITVNDVIKWGEDAFPAITKPNERRR